MKKRTSAQVAAAVVATVFACGILLSGDDVKASWLKYYSVAVLVLLLLGGIWENWLWRQPLSQKLKTTPVNMRGTWKGLLSSDWKDPNTGKTISEKPVYLVVRQTASTIDIALLTDESRSLSDIGVISRERDGVRVGYLYMNRPSKEDRDRGSQIHYGAGALRVVGKPAKGLEGEYWTDRKTGGKLALTQHSPSTADTYREAVQLFPKGLN